ARDQTDEAMAEKPATNGDKVLEYLKQLQALLAAVLPFISTKTDILPFLNPMISADLWVVTTIFSVLACFVTYNLAKGAGLEAASRKFGLWGGVIAFVALITLIILVTVGPLENFPRIEDLTARSLYVIIFLGLGSTIGWSTSKIL